MNIRFIFSIFLVLLTAACGKNSSRETTFDHGPIDLLQGYWQGRCEPIPDQENPYATHVFQFTKDGHLEINATLYKDADCKKASRNQFIGSYTVQLGPERPAQEGQRVYPIDFTFYDVTSRSYQTFYGLVKIDQNELQFSSHAKNKELRPRTLATNEVYARINNPPQTLSTLNSKNNPKD